MIELCAMEFLRKILNFERTTSETLNPNFREDAFQPCNFITSRWSSFKGEVRTRVSALRLCCVPQTSKTVRLEESNRGLFVFKTTVLYRVKRERERNPLFVARELLK